MLYFHVSDLVYRLELTQIAIDVSEIPITKIFSDFDYEFYLSKLCYVTDILNIEQIGKLKRFYFNFAQLEATRARNDKQFFLANALGAEEIERLDINKILDVLRPYAEKQNEHK